MTSRLLRQNFISKTHAQLHYSSNCLLTQYSVPFYSLQLMMFYFRPYGPLGACLFLTQAWVQLFYLQPLTVVMFTFTLPQPGTATTGYDCENQSSKVGTISLEQVGDCSPFNSTYGNEETVQVQVLQRSYRTSIPVYSCTLRMSREVCACRFFTNSHFGCQDLIGY